MDIVRDVALPLPDGLEPLVGHVLSGLVRRFREQLRDALPRMLAAESFGLAEPGC